MSPEMKQRVTTVVDVAKTCFHWGFIPTVLYLGTDLVLSLKFGRVTSKFMSLAITKILVLVYLCSQHHFVGFLRMRSRARLNENFQFPCKEQFGISSERYRQRRSRRRVTQSAKSSFHVAAKPPPESTANCSTTVAVPLNDQTVSYMA